MSLIALILYLVLLGVLLWAIQTHAPINATFKKIITVVIVIAAIMLCLYSFGVLGEMQGVRVPQIK